MSELSSPPITLAVLEQAYIIVVCPRNKTLHCYEGESR
jgi:hypothetical protein